MKLIKKLVIISQLIIMANVASFESIEKTSPNLKQISFKTKGGFNGRTFSMDVHPQDDRIVVAVSDEGGLFKTTDGGINWKHLNTNGYFWFRNIRFLPYNPGIIIATSRNNFPYGNKAPNGIWRSTDNGGTWSAPGIRFPSGTGIDSMNFEGFGISIEPNSHRIWVGTSHGLVYSDDSGETWNFKFPYPGIIQNHIICILTPRDNYLIVRDQYGVASSTDGGSTWQRPQNSSGLPQNITHGDRGDNQIAVSPLNDRHLFWALNYKINNETEFNSLYHSTDRGVTWKRIFDLEIKYWTNFVRTTKLVSDNQQEFMLYYCNGLDQIKRTIVTEFSQTGINADFGNWEDIKENHADIHHILFKNENASPYFLCTDGGIERIDDSLNCIGTGAGPGSYNAMLITDVTGQFQQDNQMCDLYFGTQDNGAWASRDPNDMWAGPNGNPGGNDINHTKIHREHINPSEVRLFGSNYGRGGLLYMGTHLLQTDGNYSMLPPGVWNTMHADRSIIPLKIPRNFLLDVSDDLTHTFHIFFSTDNANTWTERFTEEQEIFTVSQISGTQDNPVIFSPIKATGAIYGSEVIRLRKYSGLYSHQEGVKTQVGGNSYALGWQWFSFSRYVSYGVHPFDTNFIIIADVMNKVIKKTANGGVTWENDSLLTNLVTKHGLYNFNWGVNSQVLSFGFDPDYPEHILVGTRQAGIFESCDNGKTWSYVENSDEISNVKGFFFMNNNEVIVCSYGRGLWKYKAGICSSLFLNERFERYRRMFIPAYVNITKPVIVEQFEVSLLEDIIPDDSSIYYLARNGDISGFRLVENSSEIMNISLTSGSIHAFSVGGKIKKNEIGIRTEKEKNEQWNEHVTKLLKDNGMKVKGIYSKGNVFKGIILSKNDISRSQLPEKFTAKERIITDVPSEIQIGEKKYATIGVKCLNFNPELPLTIMTDGKVIKNIKFKKGKKNEFSFQIKRESSAGMHSIIVRQGRKTGVFTYCLTHGERDK